MFEVTSDPHGFNGDMYIGLWVLAGIVAFIMLEKLVAAFEEDDGDGEAAAAAAAAATAAAAAAAEASLAEAEDGDGNTMRVTRSRSRKRSSASGSESSSSKPTPATPSRRPSTPTRGSPGGGSNNAVVDRSPATSGYLNLLVNTLDNFTHGK